MIVSILESSKYRVDYIRPRHRHSQSTHPCIPVYLGNQVVALITTDLASVPAVGPIWFAPDDKNSVEDVKVVLDYFASFFISIDFTRGNKLYENQQVIDLLPKEVNCVKLPIPSQNYPKDYLDSIEAVRKVHIANMRNTSLGKELEGLIAKCDVFEGSLSMAKYATRAKKCICDAFWLGIELPETITEIKCSSIYSMSLSSLEEMNETKYIKIKFDERVNVFGLIEALYEQGFRYINFDKGVHDKSKIPPIESIRKHFPDLKSLIIKGRHLVRDVDESLTSMLG
jgi:hypothetical protein